MLAGNYFALCASHDWTYELSDDHSKYLKGLGRFNFLMDTALTQPELFPIFKAWERYVFSGPAWGYAPQAPRPELSAFDPNESNAQLSVLDPT